MLIDARKSDCEREPVVDLPHDVRGMQRIAITSCDLKASVFDESVLQRAARLARALHRYGLAECQLLTANLVRFQERLAVVVQVALPSEVKVA